MKMIHIAKAAERLVNQFVTTPNKAILKAFTMKATIPTDADFEAVEFLMRA